MPRRIVMLRAVNVGGAKLPMALLREIAESIGAAEMPTASILRTIGESMRAPLSTADSGYTARNYC